MNSSAARRRSGVMRWSAPLSSRLTRIGSSSIASTTGRSLSARAAKTSSPFCRQFPASIPARSLTCTSATDTESTRSPTSLRVLANPDFIRCQAPCTGRDRAPISAMASAGAAASSKSTKTVWKRPSSSSRRSSSRTRLVLPIRRCAVSRVWVPSLTRSARASSSASRLKNRSPSTQLAPAFLSTIRAPFHNGFVGNECVGKPKVCQWGRGPGKRATGNHGGLRAPFPRTGGRIHSAEGAVDLCVMAPASARGPCGFLRYRPS